MSDAVVSDAEAAPAEIEERGLKRGLDWLETAAMAFSSCGASAGLFSLFAFALFFAGAPFFWGWPIVGIGVGLICLVWAELSSHYPYAGVLYQWPSFVVGRRIGWLIGWMNMFAMIALLTAYYFVLPLTIRAIFDLPSTVPWNVGIAMGALAVAAIMNALGIKLLGRFTELGVAAELFLIFVITTLVLIFGATQSPSVLFDLQVGGADVSFGDWLPSFLAGGLFIALWVLYTFENAGTLGEETKDAARRAPKSVLLAWAGTMVLGLYYLLGFIIAIPDMSAFVESGGGMNDIIRFHLPDGVEILYLGLITWVVILGANVAFTAASRQMYGMARDGLLPFSRQLSRTRNGTPYVAILTCALLTGVPFVVSTEIYALITGATAAMFFSYFLVIAACFVAVLKGWPHGKEAPFSLGRWRKLVFGLATLATGAFVADLLWFREATNPFWLGTPVPVAFWIIGAPLIAGLLYYAFVMRKKLAPGKKEVEVFATPDVAGEEGSH
jgi:amino acid transporter